MHVVCSAEKAKSTPTIHDEYLYPSFECFDYKCITGAPKT